MGEGVGGGEEGEGEETGEEEGEGGGALKQEAEEALQCPLDVQEEEEQEDVALTLFVLSPLFLP